MIKEPFHVRIKSKKDFIFLKSMLRSNRYTFDEVLLRSPEFDKYDRGDYWMIINNDKINYVTQPMTSEKVLVGNNFNYEGVLKSKFVDIIVFYRKNKIKKIFQK